MKRKRFTQMQAWPGSLLYQDQDSELGRVEDSISNKQLFSHIVSHSIRKCVRYDRLNSIPGVTLCPFKIISMIFKGDLLQAEAL